MGWCGLYEWENNILVWTCLEKRKKEIQKRNGSINYEVKTQLKYILDKSEWKVSNFNKVFIFWYNIIIILYIVEVIDESHMNLILTKLKLRLTWKFFMCVFWSQN